MSLHPFDLAVLNRQLSARGYAPAPGNAQWFEPAPPQPPPSQEDEP